MNFFMLHGEKNHKMLECLMVRSIVRGVFNAGQKINIDEKQGKGLRYKLIIEVYWNGEFVCIKERS